LLVANLNHDVSKLICRPAAHSLAAAISRSS
jgi:hypothetical protein